MVKRGGGDTKEQGVVEDQSKPDRFYYCLGEASAIGQGLEWLNPGTNSAVN